MKNNKKKHLDFIVDKLTNSIQNRISGDSFLTEVNKIDKAALKEITKKAGWNFNWKGELANSQSEVYKLTIVNNAAVIQGLLSFSIKPDHIYMNLIESAPFNLGKDKVYEGVPGNLVAFACKCSFENGFDGFLSFTAKTKLITHYENTLGAYHFGNHLMIIDTKAAKKLVEKYF